LKVVESSADLFVLIVGSRYGSAADHGKSVTNLEYLAAKSKGIPLFVFISRSILDILPVWKDNPGGNYSHVTDSPKLFEFVASLKDYGAHWVFPFDVAQDIFSTLKVQLSYLFMDALTLRLKMGTGGLLPAFRELPGTMLRLIVEKLPFWEHLLLAEGLEFEVHALAGLKRDWMFGIAVGQGTSMSPRAYSKWCRTKLDEASRICGNANRVINEALPKALGPPGVAGDAEAIVYCARRLADLYRSAMEWKLDFARVQLPEEMTRAKAISASFCDNMVREIEEFCVNFKRDLKTAIADVQLGKPVVFTATLKLTGPGASDLEAELDRVAELVRSGELSWD
jgi:hypothetical protein